VYEDTEVGRKEANVYDSKYTGTGVTFKKIYYSEKSSLPKTGKTDTRKKANKSLKLIVNIPSPFVILEVC
jgi:hypothetical protein